jgi:hypothetical protein
MAAAIPCARLQTLELPMNVMLVPIVHIHIPVSRLGRPMEEVQSCTGATDLENQCRISRTRPAVQRMAVAG